jgi:pyruvate formate lyase activating enzyme
MKECYLYQKLAGHLVQCQTCNQFCKIAQDKRGVCGVRENKDGILYLLVYGKAIAVHIDPIEKKPLYHFMPNTKTFSIATVGCNFRCFWCQNADISQAPKETGYKIPIDNIPYEKLTPAQIIKETIKNQCPSISYTYTEPTIFLEYALDTMKLARKNGLKNIWVSNGYMSPRTLKLILPYLDAINVDLKSFKNKTYQKYCGAKLQPILDNLIEIYKNKVHLEITTLIIPDLNDSPQELRQIAEFIAKKLSKNIPWHISRFFPSYKMQETKITPLETIEKTIKIGKKAGLKYVYGGNI